MEVEGVDEGGGLFEDEEEEEEEGPACARALADEMPVHDMMYLFLSFFILSSLSTRDRRRW